MGDNPSQPDKLPLSVFIIARDEADRITRTIHSVQGWADEIIVVDSGSTDGTVELCRELGARTEFREWSGYGEQKRYAESLCRNDWVLNLDADEELSVELQAEIRALWDAGEPVGTAYQLPFLGVHAWQEKGHPWTVSNYPIRLYRRSCGSFDPSPVHDSVQMSSGSVERLKGMVLHRSFRSLGHHVQKVNEYSSAQAEDLFRKGREPGLLKLLFSPPVTFLICYFLRREFVNGMDGIITSYLHAFKRFIRLAKARECFQRARHQHKQV